MSFFGKIFKKTTKSNGLPDAIAFVDYEHWFISFQKQFHTTPDIKAWYETMSRKCNITEVIFFANFSKFEHKEEEVKKIRSFTNKIIDTFNPDLVSEKDYTDFIILDNIYQSVLSNKSNEMYILFTGDGHFHSVVAFLKNICRKEVGVYAVKGCINKNLYSSASWVCEVSDHTSQEQKINSYILGNLYKLKDSKTVFPTFSKTSQIVAAQNNLNEYAVRSALSDLIKDGYIKQETKVLKGHKKDEENGSIRILSVNWKKVGKDKLMSDAENDFKY